jgi:Flp pilus assembly pilin Flp
LQDLLTQEEGLDLAEFALVAALVSTAGVVALSWISTEVVGMLSSLNSAW